jgi:P-type Mg2+ transporter
MRVDRAVDVNGAPSRRARHLATLNSHFETGIKSPLDAALLAHCDVEWSAYKKVDEIPFDFERRRVSIVLDAPDGDRLLVTKGAPEQLMPLVTRVEIDGRAVACDEVRRRACSSQYEVLGDEGLRVLTVAYRVMDRRDSYSREDERDLVLAGFVAFADPVLPDAAATIDDLRRDGVAVKILTGDNDAVARHMCDKVGILCVASTSGSQTNQEMP